MTGGGIKPSAKSHKNKTLNNIINKSTTKTPPEK
jgi:hypothetical protein